MGDETEGTGGRAGDARGRGDAADPAPADALRFLADASAILAQSLDPPALLDAVAALAVPRLGDICVVYLVEGGVHTRRVGAHRLSPDARAAVDALFALADPPGTRGRVREVLDTGVAVASERLTDADFDAFAGTASPELRALARRAGGESYVVVPLAARGERFGALTFFSVAGRRRLGPAEFALAQELAARAGVAIDNARQHAALQAEVRQRRVAEAALRERERAMNTLLQNLPGAAYRMRVDPYWTAEFLSEGTLALAGRPPADFLDQRRVHWEGVIHPDDRAWVRAATVEAVAAGRRFQLTYRIVTASGETRWVWEQGCGVGQTAAGVPVVEGFITDVNDAQTAQEALRASEERYRVLARATSDAIYDWTLPDGRITWGEAAGAVFGHDFAAVQPTSEWWLEHVHPDDRERVAASLKTTYASDSAGWTAEYRFRRADGSHAHVLVRSSFLRDAGGRVVRVIGSVADVSKERQLEAQLRQAQKMEVVGRLAGGIAHDFNNLLSAILGGVDLARAALPPDSQPATDLADARDAAGRAAQLTRQLLAFSRKPAADVRVLDLTAVVSGALGILRRLVGDEAALDAALAPEPLPVRADPGQLEQVLLNLVVNARDAVAAAGPPPDAGTAAPHLITVETTHEVLAAGDARLTRGGALGPLPAGAYVALTVRDTGIGMDAATQARAAEPFFTTKTEGTGLGLSTVFGIAAEGGGTVCVHSAPGAGTAVMVLLPAVADTPEAATVIATPPPRGTETVLLVEDEAVVRATARRILERGGYTVYEARHGADALLVWRERGGAVDLVVTDLRMSVMGGAALLERLRAERPELPAVLMTGYPGEGAPARPGAAATDAVLAKPFAIDALLTAVRAALDRAPDPPSPAPAPSA